MQVVTQSLPFLNNPNQTYRIISHADHNFCIDYNSHGQIIIAQCSHAKTQIWRVVNDNQGHFGFMNVQNGNFLQIPRQSNGQQGVQCIVSQPNCGNNEKWRIVAYGKSYAIKSCLNPEIGLDVFQERMQDKNKIIVWQFESNKPNQLWCFIPV